MKKKLQPLTPKEKSQRRQIIMDEIAAKVTHNPAMTWRRLETQIKKIYETENRIVFRLFD